MLLGTVIGRMRSIGVGPRMGNTRLKAHTWCSLMEVFPNSKLSGEARFLKLGIPNFSSLEIQSKSMRYFLRFCLFNVGQYKLELHSIT